MHKNVGRENLGLFLITNIFQFSCTIFNASAGCLKEF